MSGHVGPHTNGPLTAGFVSSFSVVQVVLKIVHKPIIFAEDLQGLPQEIPDEFVRHGVEVMLRLDCTMKD